MQLPQEIINLIIQHTKGDPTTLCNLCLVSTSLLSEAQRVLYYETKIVFVFNQHLLWKKSICMGQGMGFLRTIVKHNTALAKYIRKLHLPNYGRSEYILLVRQGLQLMDNLEILTGSIPDILLPKDCVFRLRALEDVWALYGLNQYSYSRVMATQLLVSQTGLKSLFIKGDSSFNEPFPKTFFPTLEALGGNRFVIETILPGRPSVTILFWVSSDQDVPMLRPTFTSCLLNLRILTLFGRHTRLDLSLILHYLPTLQVLHLYGESGKVSTTSLKPNTVI